LEALEKNAREAMELWLESAKEDGDVIPPATDAVGLLMVDTEGEEVTGVIGGVLAPAHHKVAV